MDPRRRALLMVLIFVGLLVFHLWLLNRVTSARNTVLSVLLAIAVGLFSWRIAHYVGRYRGVVAARKDTPAMERRRILMIVPVIAALLPIHAWLLSLTLAMGDYPLTGVLILSVVVFVARLVFYARRYLSLRAAV